MAMLWLSCKRALRIPFAAPPQVQGEGAWPASLPEALGSDSPPEVAHGGIDFPLSALLRAAEKRRRNPLQGPLGPKSDSLFGWALPLSPQVRQGICQPARGCLAAGAGGRARSRVPRNSRPAKL